MKKLLALTLAALMLLLCACSSEQKIVGTAPTGDDAPTSGTTEPIPTGTYPQTPGETGGTPSESYRYSELPEDYTPEAALADGCLVIRWDEGETVPEVIGVDYWNTFLASSAKHESISMRVVYFNAERCWFTDIYYNGGRYSLYTKDIYSEKQIGPYQYLIKIEGEDLYSGEPVSYFVLTDDAELGSEQVLSLSYICDIEAERNISFAIVDFTTYFQP